MNNKEYKIKLKTYLLRYKGLCPICKPHSGCNKMSRYKKIKNWKNYRKLKHK